MSPLTASCSSDDNLVNDQGGGVEPQDLFLLLIFDCVLLCSIEDRIVIEQFLSIASEALKMSSVRKTSLYKNKALFL